MADYAIETVVATGQEETIERVKAALAERGFGVLSEIDVQAKLQEKLGVDFKPYVILGACHPPSAHRALTEEESIGVLMPCNVVVHETEGGTAVKAVRPSVSLGATGREDLADLADDIEKMLGDMVQQL